MEKRGGESESRGPDEERTAYPVITGKGQPEKYPRGRLSTLKRECDWLRRGSGGFVHRAFP